MHEDESGMGTRIRQIGSASRSVVSTISESRINYWASYVVDFSCPVLFAWLGYRLHQGWLAIVLSFLFGLAVFSLVEYSIHRWLLHNPSTVLFRLHEAHHIDPEKPAAFIFPTSLIALTLLWYLLTAIHFQSASFFICGFSAGYCYFGALHHLEHTTRINQIPFRWLQRRWAAHSVHHHIDQSNFGVITSFWDFVFRTQQKQKKRKSLLA